MPRRLRTIAALLALFAYAITATGSAALHELAGCKHGHAHCRGHATGERHEPGQDQYYTNGKIASLTTSDGDESGHDEEHCPICQFHAQAQCLLTVGAIADFDRPLALPPVAASPRVDILTARAFDSRGPPLRVAAI